MYLRMMMAIVMSLACVLATRAAEYDPLSAGPSFEAETVEWTVRDAARDRDIPLRVYLPALRAAEPVVLFSHGLGGSRDGCSYLGQHWAARGYVAVFLQHPGSDDSVWRDKSSKRKIVGRENSTLRLMFSDSIVRRFPQDVQSEGFHDIAQVGDTADPHGEPLQSFTFPQVLR